MSKGVLWFSDEIPESRVHYFYSGNYLNILKNSLSHAPEESHVDGELLSLFIPKGQTFQVRTATSYDKNKFVEKVRLLM